MKAIALEPGTKNVKLIDWEEPQIKKENEIKVKVLRVGICGTDREETSGGRADAPKGKNSSLLVMRCFQKSWPLGKK